MPELPEVEVTRRGLAPDLLGRRFTGAVVRQSMLRFPVPEDLNMGVGQILENLDRRGKYLIFRFYRGNIILHLGMSGSLRLLSPGVPAARHDHVDLLFDDVLVRLRDPRRFGAVLWQGGQAEDHPLLAGLGLEPLSLAMTADWLWSATRGRKSAIKQVIMNGKLLVGVGNIYASESLFRAAIHPERSAASLSRDDCSRLVRAIRETLEAALIAGGSTLRDFIQSDGSSGYFQQQHFVYGRDGEPCRICGTPILGLRQGNRSTFCCPRCQH